MSSPSPLSRTKTRNPRTQAQIRRDVFWQIGLPLGVAFLALVSAGVWVVLPQGAATRSPLADVSLIMLICPAALLALVTLALVGGLCVGMYYALRELPFLLKRVQDVLVLVVYYTLPGGWIGGSRLGPGRGLHLRQRRRKKRRVPPRTTTE
jgi:hypothetical protein